MIFNTMYQTAPFSQYNENVFKEKIEEQIEIVGKKIEEISNSKEKPTFENTIEELAYLDLDLDRLTSMFYNLLSAEATEKLQALAREISPRITEFENDIVLNKKLFEKVKTVYETYTPKTKEEKTLLEVTYKSFVRNGANLKDNERDILRKIDKELSLKRLQFSENLLRETNQYQLVVENKEDLEEIPQYTLDQAEKKAKEVGKKGWVFTLDFPVYTSVLKYAKNRELRKAIFKAYASRCSLNNENNNTQIVIDIAKLKDQRAKLLGYESHSAFTLERSMAKTPEAVLTFLNNLLKKAMPKAREEFLNLQKYAKKLDGISDFSKWDTAYYSEKLKRELFDIDDQMLKPYFSLENVLKGAFALAQRLYGLKFTEIDNIEKYHPEVRTFCVTDSKDEYVSVLYADFHPRATKKNGAWMTSFKRQYITREGENSRPHISIVCNFSQKTDSTPSLLTFNEVTTLFHEFGHALHGMLANTKYPSLSGTSVFRDFVELPSQFMENWCYRKETLSLFAKHYKSGELIPMEYVEKIQQASAFGEALQTLRQLGFGFLDMKWHTACPNVSADDIKKFERQAMNPTNLYPVVEEEVTSTAFSHIFSGGYSSGYYSYKWSEVLDADAFEYFKEQGLFNQEIARKFKENILEKGASQDPMDLYVAFRGKKPSIDPLLRRAKLI